MSVTALRELLTYRLGRDPVDWLTARRRDGPVSLDNAASEITRQTGVQVTGETLRRWTAEDQPADTPEQERS